MGMTVADWWGVSKRPKNATFMRDIDHDAFFTMLTERIGRLGRPVQPVSPQGLAIA